MTQGNHGKDETLLISVAESIGSTLGTIAAKANAAPKVFSDVAHSVEREGQRLKRKTKNVARRLASSRTRKVKKSKPAKGTVRRAKSSVKRVARRATAKKAAGRKSRRRK